MAGRTVGVGNALRDFRASEADKVTANKAPRIKLGNNILTALTPHFPQQPRLIRNARRHGRGDTQAPVLDALLARRVAVNPNGRNTRQPPKKTKADQTVVLADIPPSSPPPKIRQALESLTSIGARLPLKLGGSGGGHEGLGFYTRRCPCIGDSLCRHRLWKRSGHQGRPGTLHVR
jgi:hypothetical protein